MNTTRPALSEREVDQIVIRLAQPDEFDTVNAIDDDATGLYALHGMPLSLGPNHEFALAEVARWRRSIELGRTFVATDATGTLLGFAALDLVDGEPYLDQLAVRISAMRRGIGGRLLERSAEWARAEGGSSLWLTTYDHMAFNRPFYERAGYVVVPEHQCSPGIRHHLLAQRQHLPGPEHRVAMRRSIHDTHAS